ncbi:hypothetical protein STENM223S_01552 [Streptomyces tendae]
MGVGARSGWRVRALCFRRLALSRQTEDVRPRRDPAPPTRRRRYISPTRQNPAPQASAPQPGYSTSPPDVGSASAEPASSNRTSARPSIRLNFRFCGRVRSSTATSSRSAGISRSLPFVSRDNA